MAISPELLKQMEAERAEYLKGDLNANNAEKGKANAELEKKQWAEEEARSLAEAKAPKPTMTSPPPPPSVVAKPVTTMTALDDPDADE